MPDVPLKCRCGKLEAVVRDARPANNNRVSCYCNDCQTFALHLGGDGILDEWGGTDICQISPGSFEFVKGIEHLAAARLSPKGLVRWHTTCCNTPVANTSQKPRLPFIGIPRVFIDADPALMHKAFGPAGKTYMTRFATGNNAELRNAESLWMTLRLAGLMGRWWVGGHLARDPLFDGKVPILEPTVIPKEERARLLARCGPNPET